MNYSIRFNSLNELRKYLDNTPQRKIWRDEYFESGYQSTCNDKEFTGTESMEEARALLSGGWVDGLNMLAPLLRVPTHYQQTKKRVQFWGVSVAVSPFLPIVPARINVSIQSSVTAPGAWSILSIIAPWVHI